MKRTFYFFITNLLASFSLFNLNAQQSSYTSFGSGQIGPQGLELKYDIPFANNFILKASAGIGAGYYVDDGTLTYSFNFSNPVPFIKSQVNWMYNKDKRIEQGKSLQNNAGNYVGLQTKYSFGKGSYTDLNSTLLTEIHWGIQRNLGQKIFFSTQIGIGYLYDFDLKDNAVSPTFGLSLGYFIF